MKVLKKQIRLMSLVIALIFSIATNAQNEEKKHDIYLRVYNLIGKKINKGSLIFINDSLLGLKDGSKQANISLREIGFIKTKRSVGNNMLISAASGAALGAIIGVSTADPDSFLGYSAGEGALGFGAIGALGGAAIGGISIAFKNSETYIIEGDLVKWKIFKEMIEKTRLH